MFTDTITLYSKTSDAEWKRTIVKGVQWTEKAEKQNNSGRISVAKYITITFPEPTYDGLVLKAENEEDCIVYGEVEDVITDEKGSRVSDLLKKYQKAGRLQSVNDNSNRKFLKNIKVVIANG